MALSKHQIGKLGQRLRASDPPAREDIELLHQLLAHYGEVLDRATSRVHRASGLSPTARVKNTGTILEKLRRQGGSSLKTIQDLAGMRIVGDFDRNGQDAVAAQLVELFRDAPKPPRIVDRRARPVSGYRAVHVIVFPEGVPVEIQVRTRAQHEWAELFEKLADRVGRGIRYGEAPAPSATNPSADLRVVTVQDALSTARFIDVFERAEQQQPQSTDLDDLREGIAKAIAILAMAINELN